MKSWDHKIYFAGEAFTKEPTRTVEAALVSGVDRARHLLAEI